MFQIEKEDIELMRNMLKSNESLFPKLEDMLCTAEKVTTGERAPDEAINFGTDHDVKYFAIDSFDDTEF